MARPTRAARQSFLILLLACTTITTTTTTTTLAFSPSLPTRRYSVHQDKLQITQDEYNIDTEIKSAATFHLQTPLPESQYTQVLTTITGATSTGDTGDDGDRNSLETHAANLRDYYDNHFSDPRQPDSNRFAWDPWYVNVGDGTNPGSDVDSNNDDNEDDDDDDDTYNQQQLVEGEREATEKQTQYSLKRIQTNSFFTEDDFSTLVEEITKLSRSIGLTAITPPWLSLYLEGDLQNFHTDASHGPLAFVLTLSREGDFEGGETMLLQPQIMDLWKGFDSSRGLETGGIMRYIPPTPVGRCIAFDPRVPHGVNRVSGTRDPRRGRIVIHGWFDQPEVCFFGPWSDDGTVGTMNAMLDEAMQPLVGMLGGGEIGRVVGYLACKIEVDEDGYVRDVYGVCDTLQADWEDFRGVIGYDEADRPVLEDAVADVKLTIYEVLKNLYFEEGEDGRSVVVPFAFE